MGWLRLLGSGGGGGGFEVARTNDGGSEVREVGTRCGSEIAQSEHCGTEFEVEKPTLL